MHLEPSKLQHNSVIVKYRGVNIFHILLKASNQILEPKPVVS